MLNLSSRICLLICASLIMVQCQEDPITEDPDPGRPFKASNECVVYYPYLPTHQGARFKYELVSDSYPDSIVFTKSISVLRMGGVVLLD